MKPSIDHTLINQAIKEAEEKTCGEITCVVRHKSFDYPETALIWAFVVALLSPIALALVGFAPDQLLRHFLPGFLSPWHIAQESLEDYNRLMSLSLAALIELLVFGLTYFFIKGFRLEAFLTPPPIKRMKAHAFALDQFRAHGFHQTDDRTGVMIFTALSEHYVEVIADEGIYSKVDKKVWDDTVAILLSHIKKGDLTTGYIEAVRACAIVLSAHFPPGKLNPNELPDVLIEL